MKTKKLLSPKDELDRQRLMECQEITGFELARLELRLEQITLLRIRELETKIMKAIDSLNQNIVALTTAVDNAVAAGIGAGTPEAQVQAAADGVAAQTAKLVAATPAPTPPAGGS